MGYRQDVAAIQFIYFMSMEMPIPWDNTKDQTSAIEGCI